MQIDEFWKHWQVNENPFRAEEARDDPVFMKLTDTETTHPDFEKVFGQPGEPSAAVVFGEKGSGKTALRLLLEKRIARQNADHPDRRAWVVRYDDLNPVFDRFGHSVRQQNRDGEKLLNQFRLADHQDAILSQAVTRLVDSLTGAHGAVPVAEDAAKTIRRMPRDKRVDLATLAILYDQPRSGSIGRRWGQMRKMLRLGWLSPLAISKWLGVLAAIAAFVLAIVGWWFTDGDASDRYLVLAGVCTAAAILLLGYWGWRNARLWWLAKKVRREVHVVERTDGQLRQMFGNVGGRELAAQPIPVPGDQDSRYQLTARLLDVLEGLGYRSLIVLVDRVDEPAVINGDAGKMKAVIWPMFNNKFLQQDRVGMKLLLPIELRHLLRREDADFFQRARLDKQHMIDRLVWSGTTLYDLCSHRLQACRDDSAEPVSLTDLFAEDVSRQDLIDALDQMQQPRDAFKFLYQTIQEHCSNVPHDEPVWRIPRLTLNQVRKQQSQRVQELQRGLSPS